MNTALDLMIEDSLSWFRCHLFVCSCR